MSRAVFQAGVSWAMIEKRWDAYEALFEGFDPKRVAAFSAGDIERIGSDPRIVRTRKKVVATVENARTMLELEREHGILRAYLRSFHGYGALSKDIRKRFAFVGELSVWYLLFRTGEPVPRFEDWEKTVPGGSSPHARDGSAGPGARARRLRPAPCAFPGTCTLPDPVRPPSTTTGRLDRLQAASDGWHVSHGCNP